MIHIFDLVLLTSCICETLYRFTNRFRLSSYEECDHSTAAVSFDRERSHTTFERVVAQYVGVIPLILIHYSTHPIQHVRMRVTQQQGLR
jgi:hypothetical protein